MPRKVQAGSSLELPSTAKVSDAQFLAMLNERLRTIERKLDELAGDRGTVKLGADLDLDGHKIINLGRAVDSNDAVSLQVGNRRWLVNPSQTTVDNVAVAGGSREKKMTFGIGIETPLVVRQDYTNHGEPISSGRPFRISIDIKIPPTGQDVILDILRRRKTAGLWGGWTSLFTVQPRYPVGTEERLDITTGFANVDIKTLTDVLRIDCIQTDGVAQDCEVVLEWE